MRSFMVHDYVEVIESYGIKYENVDIHALDLIDISSKDRIRIEYSSFKMNDAIKPAVVLSEADSKTLITKLYNLNLLDWQEHYEPEEIIMDGESRHMEIDTYNLGHIRKGGNNAFPENWHSFRNFRRWVVSRLKNS